MVARLHAYEQPSLPHHRCARSSTPGTVCDAFTVDIQTGAEFLHGVPRLLRSAKLLCEMDQNATKSPRDQWSYVLPIEQLHVNGNACNEEVR